MNVASTGKGADELREAAAAWAVRLSDASAGETDWLAFSEWLSGGEAELRREAFDQAQALWLEFGEQREALAGRMTSKPASTRRLSRWIGVAAAAAACACGLVAVAVQHIPLFHHPAPQTVAAETFVTGVGQHRLVGLPDGTRIELNSVSRLQVAYSPVLRHVWMDQAEADFDVKHEAGRPFVVEVGGGKLTVLGTAFDVAHYSGVTRVSVSRGRVRYQVQNARVVLGRGDGAVYRTGGGYIQQIAERPEDATAWRGDQLVYRGRPFTDVVNDLNRHYSTPLRLGDDGAARLSFTGVLILGPQPVLIRQLTGLLPLKAHRAGGWYVLTSRTP